jgi:hypothetical protein
MTNTPSGEKKGVESAIEREGYNSSSSFIVLYRRAIHLSRVSQDYSVSTVPALS